MEVIVAGPDDHGIGAAVEREGHAVSAVDIANRPALEEAGIHGAGTLVLTEVKQATAIPVARDLNEEVHVVVYAEGSLPDFARGQADLVVDPALLDPAMVAEELDTTAR
jgi:hypothetical protein